MFENRSYRELVIIYVVIALIVTIALGAFHYFTWPGFFRDPIVMIVAGNIEFFLIFYILFLPIKAQKERELKEKEKEKK